MESRTAPARIAGNLRLENPVSNPKPENCQNCGVKAELHWDSEMGWSCLPCQDLGESALAGEVFDAEDDGDF